MGPLSGSSWGTRKREGREDPSPALWTSERKSCMETKNKQAGVDSSHQRSFQKEKLLLKQFLSKSLMKGVRWRLRAWGEVEKPEAFQGGLHQSVRLSPGLAS